MQGPIGVFDSGYGGLTILSELQRALPEHDFLYLGDNARAPYGTRSFEVVYEYTLEAVKELFGRGCHLVILACNTASAKALRTIQQKDLPQLAPDKRVLGVIRPSTELVGSLSKSRHIGVLATPGTVKSESYKIEIQKFHPEVTVHQLACPMWVPLIENNKHETLAGMLTIKLDVDALFEIDDRIDTLVLGCTHYPVVADFIRSIVPSGVEVVTQGPIVADRLIDYLSRHPEIAEKCSKSGNTVYLTTENTHDFNETASILMDKPVVVEHITLG